MCLRILALALVVSALATTETTNVLAQEEPLINPAAPVPPASSPELAPNPFRSLDSLEPQPQEPQFGPPGFAEATDQNLFGPATPNNAGANPPITSRSTSDRRPTPTPVSTSNNSTSNDSPFSPRLARAAPIMGDSFAPSLQHTFFEMVEIDGEFFDVETVAQLPAAGGATRRKIAENTGAFPVDRFIFNYNNFQNAVESFGSASNVDRYTMGIEKTFLSSLFSIDVRFPLIANNDATIPGLFRRNGSEIGNLSVGLKALLTSDEDSAWVAGMVVDTPTGGETQVSLFDNTFLRLDNDAVHLAPFLGFLCLQDGGITHQGFIQADVATNANGFTFSDTSSAPIVTEFMEQTLLYVDYSVSKTVYEGGRQSALQRLAVLTEFHYTTTLEDADVISISTPLNNNFNLTSTGNRIDVLNFTAGIDTRLSCGANIRFGTVVPITDDDDRFFDIEFQAQVNFPL